MAGYDVSKQREVMLSVNSTVALRIFINILSGFLLKPFYDETKLDILYNELAYFLGFAMSSRKMYQPMMGNPLAFQLPTCCPKRLSDTHFSRSVALTLYYSQGKSRYCKSSFPIPLYK